VSKAIFTTKAEPIYDDLPEFRYHFPRTYLRQVEAMVGDWITYGEPRRSSADPRSRGGRQAYFAAARVTAFNGIRKLQITTMRSSLIFFSSTDRFPLGNGVIIMKPACNAQMAVPAEGRLVARFGRSQTLNLTG
jgi:hypothetical protein